MALNTAFSAGAVLTAQQMNNLPFGSVGYVNVTSSQLGISAITDLTGFSVTFTAIANRPYLAILSLNPYGNANDSADIWLYDGTTTIVKQNRMYFTFNNVVDTRTYFAIFTLSAGSHTIKARMSKNGAANVNNYADNDLKGSLAIFDLGAR